MPGQNAWQELQKRVETAKIAVSAEGAFGWNLLRRMVDNTPAGNVFISPLSVFLALQMAGNGAAGSTRGAMWKALALPGSGSAGPNVSAEALHHILTKDSGGVELAIANALWADTHFQLAPDFVKLCHSVFNARAASLHFADPKAAAEINNWVKENTKGKISEIVSADVVAKAAVILTNAVYFAGTWTQEFSKDATSDAPFHKTGGGVKTVPMMHHPRVAGAYRAGPNFEGAALFYRGSTVFFYALLPVRGKTPSDVLASFDPSHLAENQGEFDLDLKLPRFNLDFGASLGWYLQAMGMDVAFRDPDADFGPMGSRLFYISEVFHKTRLEVDELGTVAAAATAVVMSAGAAMREPPEKKTLVFDRPFVVLIAESRTGAILFAGVIEEP